MAIKDLDHAPRLYLQVLGIPVATLLVAGILAPISYGLFVTAAVGASLWIVATLIFHEHIFSTKGGAPDPLPKNSLSAYLALAMGGAALVVTIITFDLHMFDRVSAVHSTAPLGAGHSDATMLLDSEAVLGVIWIILLPIMGVYGFRFLVERRSVARLLLILTALCLAASLILFITKNAARNSAPLYFETLTLIQLLVLSVSGLVSASVFFVILRAPSQVLAGLNQGGNLWLIVPSGISLADLVTIVQGFSGLYNHYSFMAGIAFGGMMALASSMLASIVFGAMCLHKGLTSRSLPHYLLAFSVSIFLGCVLMYVLAEAGGFWFQILKGAAAK